MQNNGTLFVKNGGLLYSTTNVKNTSVLQNNGEIVLNTNFLNETGGLVASSANSQLTFKGSSLSKFRGGNGNYDIVNAEKSNQNILLLDNVKVDNKVDFTAGTNAKVNTDTNVLELDKNATFVNATSTKYVIATGTGYVQKNMNPVQDFVFPIGDDTNDYSPLSITNNTSTITTGSTPRMMIDGKIKVNVIDEAAPNKPAAANDYITRYWNIETENLNPVSLKSNGAYLPADVVGTEANIGGVFTPNAASNWEYDGTGNTSRVVSADINSPNVDFTAFNTRVLPVDLLTFTATLNDLDVLISWKTATEIDNKAFTVEFSLDGKQFSEIASIEGNGTTTTEKSYSFLHENVNQFNATNLFYRLKQVDLNGSSLYSKIVMIQLDMTTNTVIYPNPVQQGNNLNFESSQAIGTYKITNALGQFIEEGKYNNGKQSINTSAFAKGWYTIIINKTELRFIVQ